MDMLRVIGIMTFASLPLLVLGAPRGLPSPDVNLGTSAEIQGAARGGPPAYLLQPGRPRVALSLNWQRTPRSDLEHEGRVGVDRQGYSAGLLFPTKPKIMIGASWEQEFSQYDFDNVNNPMLNDLFNRITVSRISATLRGPINDTWSYFLAADVSDAIEVGADWEKGVTAGGILSFRCQASSNFAYSIGFFGHDRLEENPLIFPIPSFEWQITDRLGFRTAQGVTLDYKLGREKSWFVDLSGKYEGREVRLNKDGPVADGTVADRRVPVLLGLNYRPHPGLHLHVYGGYVAWQEYKIIDGDGEDLSVEKTDPTVVLGASGSLRF